MGQEVVSLRERATKLGVEKKTLPGTLLHNIGIPVRTSPSNEAPAQPQQEKHAKRLSVSPSRSASKSVRRGRPKLTEPILIETEDGEKKLVTPEEWRLLRRRITNRMSARRQKDKRESTSGGGSRQTALRRLPAAERDDSVQFQATMNTSRPDPAYEAAQPLNKAPTLIRPTPWAPRYGGAFKAPVARHLGNLDAQQASVNEPSAFTSCSAAAAIFKNIPNLPPGLLQTFDMANKHGKRMSQSVLPSQPQSASQVQQPTLATAAAFVSRDNPFFRQEYLSHSGLPAFNPILHQLVHDPEFAAQAQQRQDEEPGHDMAHQEDEESDEQETENEMDERDDIRPQGGSYRFRSR